MSAGARRAAEPIGDDAAWLSRLLRRAGDNAHLLYDREVAFVDQLRARFGRFDAETFVSPKQRAWLLRIEKRLDRRGVAAEPEGAGA